MTRTTLVWLDSVGAFLNADTLETHPADRAGNPILDQGEIVHFDDTPDAWRSSLSAADRETIARAKGGDAD